ncbi:hypothetical protein D1AOALGA4SA_10367 [Olavius algarvensis Delta 1 endosymbiont]|nr:hypothetical protein D1AOALGA4SA_10367 [Olavius algarvensis Delta 1 endosymbiont]
MLQRRSARNRFTIYRRQRTEVRGQRTDKVICYWLFVIRSICGGLRTDKVICYWLFVIRSNCGGQRTEVRGQRTEDRGLRTEVRGQRTDDRGQKIGKSECGLRQAQARQSGERIGIRHWAFGIREKRKV